MKRILFSIAYISLVSAAFAQTDVSDQNAQLIQAAKDSNLSAVQTLLAGGADVNARRTADGVTALMWAALNGNAEIAGLLIEKGADINAKSNDGLTVLGAAKSSDHKDIVQLLEKKLATLNPAEKSIPDGNTESFALHKAAYEGNLEEVKALIAKGADVNAKAQNGRTALFVAANKGYADLAELLIAKGADINVKDNTGKTALDIAKEKGRTDIVQLLEKKLATLGPAEKSTPDGNTAMHKAAYEGNFEKIKTLIAKGADVNVPKELFLGSPGDDVFLFGQWYDRESFNPPVTPRAGSTFNTFRWTAGDAGIYWPVTPAREYRLQLACTIRPYASEPNIYVNGQYVATIRGTDWQFLDVTIPAKTIGENRVAQVEIKSRTWVPAQKEPSSSDKRNLAVMVASFSLTELSQDNHRRD